MKKSAVLIIIGLIFFCGIESGSLLAQTNIQSEPGSSRIPAIMRLLYNRVIVSRLTNGPLIGLLVGVENNSLVIKIKEEEQMISYNDIAEIIIEVKKNSGSNIVLGMLGGAYLGNLIFDRAENQPPVFVNREGESGVWLLFKNALYACAGGALIYLVNYVSKNSEKKFTFSKDPIKRLKTWEKLKRFIIGYEPELAKFHLALQACHVFTPVRNWYANVFPGAYDFSGEMKINLLRKVQFTYSIRTDLEVGAAWIALGDPGYSGRYWQNKKLSWFNLYKDDYGFYGVLIYKPFDHILSNKMEWGIGGGLGPAKLDIALRAGTRSGYPDYIEKEEEHKISEVKLSGVLFSNLTFKLSRIFSFGLYADYVYILPEKIPEFPNINIPGKKFNLGNASMGLSFGINF